MIDLEALLRKGLQEIDALYEAGEIEAPLSRDEEGAVILAEFVDSLWVVDLSTFTQHDVLEAARRVLSC